MKALKSTSRGQGRLGDQPSEGSPSANLRAYAQTKTAGSSFEQLSWPRG
ncbi:MAG: hypothetical protein GY820_04470 [Gammaproteobacteria bacterium]|nr:hypothetical protein [Gammaproteobacteria bacterium]MCP4486562.1 hypothetical protein [Gammaproteobacteria bacterium]